MTKTFEKRAREALADSPLAERLERAADALERLDDNPELRNMSSAALAGVARTIAAQPEAGAFLSRRAHLHARLASADAHTLDEREHELLGWQLKDPEDLEDCLDSLRLLRRDDTCLAAFLHFGGLVSFDRVSSFLSTLAETITRRALELAKRGSEVPAFAVVGMGKIAGREFTYHSDLDLLFLYEGGPDAVAAASRVGQRLVSYLTTMTGAGVAYAVDTRLRPSGRQGMLVTSLPAFERYQSEQAETWEHVALLRARPIAGSVEEVGEALARVHTQVCERHDAPWPALLEMRRRVEAERSADDAAGIAFKTGAGGLMDVDFLAGGGLLERDAARLPRVPAVPTMLRAAAAGPAVEELLEDYASLRRVEAAARWWAGRGVEALPRESLDVLGELLQPGLSGPALRKQVLDTRQRVRAAWDRVIAAGSIAALES